jgi:hypothetical protein
MYTEDSESKDKLQQILAIAPQHKAAIAYMNKVNLNQALTPAEKEDINKFLKLLKR